MEKPAQNFTYGLNIFFKEKDVPVPSAAAALPAVSGARATPLSGGDGVYVHLPKGSASLVRIVLSGSTRIVIAVDEGAKTTFIESGAAGRLSVDMTVGAGADVRYISGRSDGVEFSERRADVAQDAKLTWISAHLGARFGYGRTATRLIGRGASVRERAMYLGAASDRFDLYSEVRHEADATTSDLLIRGALDGKSKAIVRGLVNIAAGTSGCVGRQKEDTLLLGPDAEVDAVPMLEIGTGDVRCSHSASTGRLDDEKLFYLMSRGLDRGRAARAVIEGFFAPVTAEIADDPVLVEAVESRLSRIV
ncbi:MAG: SufD family Fe-S cluster assembly protein [Patescibacteria group bacterium]